MTQWVKAPTTGPDNSWDPYSRKREQNLTSVPPSSTSMLWHGCVCTHMTKRPRQGQTRERDREGELLKKKNNLFVIKADALCVEFQASHHISSCQTLHFYIREKVIKCASFESNSQEQFESHQLIPWSEVQGWLASESTLCKKSWSPQAFGPWGKLLFTQLKIDPELMLTHLLNTTREKTPWDISSVWMGFSEGSRMQGSESLSVFWGGRGAISPQRGCERPS